MSENNEFNQWNELKKQINSTKPNKISIAKIYWLSVGKNVGSEVYGKGVEFIRPVLVLKKVGANAFIGVPLSTKTKCKTGIFYHHLTDSKKIPQVALISQIRLFDTRRVKGFKSRISKSDFNEIKQKVVGLFA